jgi:hypothetical protein
LCCVLIFGLPPCWLLTLWLPLLAITPSLSACSYNPICATWNFSFGEGLVMVLRLAFYGAATKPRASCGRTTHGCAARHTLVLRFLIMIHYGTTSMSYLLVSFSLVISPYPIRRSIYRTKSSRAFFRSSNKDSLWSIGHWCGSMVCAECAIRSEIILGTPDGTPSRRGSSGSSFLFLCRQC